MPLTIIPADGEAARWDALNHIVYMQRRIRSEWETSEKSRVAFREELRELFVDLGCAPDEVKALMYEYDGEDDE